jgi:hypothetical protein
MISLESAIALAVKAHEGQTDKAGQPYILHPLRVMFSVSSELEQIVAVLHDVVEDSKFSLSDLEEIGYPDAVLEALDCLTRRSQESYEQFINRVKVNPLATRVKIADIEDNLNICRLQTITDSDLARIKKYLNAWHALISR